MIKASTDRTLTRLRHLDAAIWVRLYSLATMGAVGYGIFIAHLGLLGWPWTHVTEVASIIALHGLEGPLTIYLAVVAWIGARRFQRISRATYRVLLQYAIVAKALFFVFEMQLLIACIERGAPARESWLTASVAAILLCGVASGIAVQLVLVREPARPEISRNSRNVGGGVLINS